MYCTKCGHKNDDQARFCASCGAPLETAGGEVASKKDVPTSSTAAGYAGFWRRFVAWFIDVLLVGLVFGIFYFASPSVQGVLSLVAWWLYYALMESSSLQATIGKSAMGIVVTDMDGRRVTFWRATGRYFSKVVLMFLLFLPYIVSCVAIAFTRRKQAFHDMIAGCLVLKKE